MNTAKSIELKILKAILWIYISLCIIIAGLNYGYASHATEDTAKLITWFWHFYENWVKTFFIVTCSFLTLKIVGSSQITVMRKRNLIGFIVSAIVVHIAGPLLLKNSELYFFAMPLPWSTTPLQLLDTTTNFYISRLPAWGVTGITAALIFYAWISAIIILGTLFLGRRWQCSTLCLFNGFASEVFAPAFPLVGKIRKVKPRQLRILFILKWVFLCISLFFSFYWALHLLKVPLPGNINVISSVENYKYLTGELFTAMFFWIAFIGRGYCYYCPLGTMLGLLGKLAGQKILTNNTKCVQCNQCNSACSMAIDISSKAKDGEAVKNLRCVGCGHCVDACPTRTLSYSTIFLQKMKEVYKTEKDISM
ncbi:4Fe-4S binding protein [Dehalobacter sp. DCM]|uniref:4Fe-4S binding protein n=1 Tax=Dehalobacter sp. DCM TaxID=2907827 RepID=UPI003081389D|nr:4Fe-4S binding protein [Dehalobacter sp. DCM]